MRYFDSFQKEDNDALTKALALWFARKAGPIAPELERAVEQKDYASLVNYNIDYSLFCDPVSIFAARQCLALYQKRDDIDIGIDKEQVALDKFIESEQVCRESNLRISRSRVSGSGDPDVDAVIFTAQRKIARILGDFPSLDNLQLEFGPGSNTNCRLRTSARWKLSAKPACSSNMASTVFQVLEACPAYLDLHSYYQDEKSWKCEVEIQLGELLFVLKNAKTYRSIIREPSMNSLAQKGYGKHLKERLFDAGVNLFDQSVNQTRARLGSINGALMTVDLSSASDTICRELVSELLPLDWYIGLRQLTTTEVEYKKQGLTFSLEKFSSMGNGFTFELESLIFYALTVGVCHTSGIKPDVSVFGDDIICPAEALPLLTKVFQFCGFSINTAKSFSTGPFRESCGADYWNGVNVRPYYQKTSWSFGAMAAFHNFLRVSGWEWCFPGVIENLADGIPFHLRNYGPAGYGDGHLVSFDLNLKPYRRDRGYCGFTFETFVKRTKRVKGMSKGDWILPVYSVYIRASEGSPYDKYVVRGDNGEKLISVYTLGRF